jgi:hypothetical protein
MFNRIKNEQHDNKKHIQHNYYEQYINHEQQHNNDDNKTYLPQTDVVLKLCLKLYPNGLTSLPSRNILSDSLAPGFLTDSIQYVESFIFIK